MRVDAVREAEASVVKVTEAVVMKTTDGVPLATMAVAVTIKAITESINNRGASGDTSFCHSL